MVAGGRAKYNKSIPPGNGAVTPDFWEIDMEAPSVNRMVGPQK